MVVLHAQVRCTSNQACHRKLASCGEQVVDRSRDHDYRRGRTAYGGAGSDLNCFTRKVLKLRDERLGVVPTADSLDCFRRNRLRRIEDLLVARATAQIA